jgi:hypothetical protein
MAWALATGCFSLVHVSVPASAAGINWTTSVVGFDGTPSSSGGGTLTITNASGTGSPTFDNLDLGFGLSNALFTYTTAKNGSDAGKSIVIDWTITRDFDNPASKFMNTSDLGGRMTLPANASGFVTMSTIHVNEGQASNAFVTTATFETTDTGKTFPFDKMKDSDPFDHAGGPDKLQQNGLWFITVGADAAGGQVFKLELNGAAVSATQPLMFGQIPEPASLTILVPGLLVLIGCARRARRDTRGKWTEP